MDSAGALTVILNRAVRDSELLLNNFDQSLIVLAGCCQRALQSEILLQEVVRAADIEWGRTMSERPFLNKPGCPSHPDDPYTDESIRDARSGIFEQLVPGET